MLSESYGAKLTKLLTIINTFMRSHFRVEQSNYYVQAISKTVAKVDSQSERVEILNTISKQLKRLQLGIIKKISTPMNVKFVVLCARCFMRILVYLIWMASQARVPNPDLISNLLDL